MKNVVLVHGCCDKEEFYSEEYPSASNSHWFPWLQKQLVVNGFETQTPEMPEPFKPDYEKWANVFKNFPIDAETILVGHSCGAGFLLRYLGDHKSKIATLILIAPWLDPIKKRKGFLDFEIDASIAERVGEIHIFFSNDEPVEGVRESVHIIQSKLPNVVMHSFDDKGHFTFDEMKTVEFPELRDVILRSVPDKEA